MFLKENKERITFNKEVKVACGYYHNAVNYVEMKWSDENV